MKHKQFDGRSGAITFGSLLAVYIIYSLGAWFGTPDVLASDRLKAQNEVLFQIVNIPRTPDDRIFEQADTACKNAHSRSKCIKNFILDVYTDQYLVNMVTGEHSLLSTTRSVVENAPIVGSDDYSTDGVIY